MINRKKSLLVALVSGVILGSTAYGKISLENVTEKLYSDVEVRQYTLNLWKAENVKDKDNLEDVARFQGRYTIGAKVLNNTLDMRAIFGVNKFFGTKAANKYKNLVYARGTTIEAEYTPYKNDFFKIMPYIEVQLPLDDKWTGVNHEDTAARVALYTEGKYDLSTGAGMITPVVGLEAVTYLSDRPSKNDSLALTSDEKVQNRNLGYESEVSGGVVYVPNFTKGLTMVVKSSMTTSYTPRAAQEVREIATVDANPEVKKYTVDHDFTQRLILSYAVNDTFEFGNDFKFGGFSKDVDGKSTKDARIKNLVYVKANLF